MARSAPNVATENRSVLPGGLAPLSLCKAVGAAGGEAKDRPKPFQKKPARGMEENVPGENLILEELEKVTFLKESLETRWQS